MEDDPTPNPLLRKQALLEKLRGKPSPRIRHDALNHGRNQPFEPSASTIRLIEVQELSEDYKIIMETIRNPSNRGAESKRFVQNTPGYEGYTRHIPEGEGIIWKEGDPIDPRDTEDTQSVPGASTEIWAGPQQLIMDFYQGPLVTTNNYEHTIFIDPATPLKWDPKKGVKGNLF
jgi:hypothetical protein